MNHGGAFLPNAKHTVGHLVSEFFLCARDLNQRESTHQLSTRAQVRVKTWMLDSRRGV